MRLSGIFGAVTLAIVSVVGLGHTVRAADLGPLYGTAPSGGTDQPLEFGTGWYLRGDGAFSFEDHPKLNLNPAQFDRNAKGDGYAIGLGAGYKFNSFLRVDVTGDYLDSFSYAAQGSCGPTCFQSTRDNIDRFDGLANAYLDLGNWGGFTPYVGAGVGLSGAHQNDSTNYADGTPGQQSRHTTYQLAWAAMAGFSYSISSNMLLDVGYRYLDLGRLVVNTPSLPAVQKDITAHQVRVGIRYMVD